MAEPKVQLVAPIGNITVPGMNVTGVVTATTITADVGVAASIIQGNNIDIGTGIITATSFVGDQIGTYRAASLTGSPDLVVGVVTSSGFVAQITGDVTGDLTGNVVGTAGSIISGKDLWVGIATATLVGDGSSLVGAAGSAFSHQTVTADGATTSIDLSAGNIITFNQSANTTVSFANTESVMNITFIRDKDDTTTARTITWPSSIKWNGGSIPTLINSAGSDNKQQFQLLTNDAGLTWYAWETYKYDGPYGKLWMWGEAGTGELGQNDKTDRSSPTQVGTDSNWASINANNYIDHTVATKADGTLWTWGDNQAGALGLNDAGPTKYRSSPMQVGTDTDWSTTIGVGYLINYAVKTDNTLWVWGTASDGNQGLNDELLRRSSPTQIPGSWSEVRPGLYNVVGVKSDGTLWTWGNNQTGALGQNNTTYYSSPTQVGTNSDWSKVDAGRHVGAAIKTNGTLWSWGYGYYGTLGQNTTGSVQRSSPVQISGTTWKSVTVNSAGMGAVKTDGTLWVWGYQDYGQLGLNQSSSNGISSPTQVGTDTNWNAYHRKSLWGFTGQQSIASKTDGTLWAWGRNEKGQFGLNDTINRSSPTQIPGTDWQKESYQFAIANEYAMGLRNP